ncbi:MAG: murein hydrolase activator EnvC family protein [Myxococcota bacterium]
MRQSFLVVALTSVLSASVALADGVNRAPEVPHAAADIEKLLKNLEREQRDALARFDSLGKEAAAAGARAAVRGRAYARLARAGFLPVGGGFRSFIDHATRLERLRRGLSADLKLQQSATVERAKLARRIEELKLRILPLQAEQAALARAEDALLSAQDRERAFQRAFESSSSGHTAVYGAQGPSDPAELGVGFGAMRGRLPFPIAGRAEIKSARRPGADGPALEMRAPLGTPVRAVYPGRVAFADAYAEYGKTVIIDHGKRHYTVSANLADIDVHVGDEVVLNTRVGSVGDSGKGALLYFEVRVGTETVDPAEWFGI